MVLTRAMRKPPKRYDPSVYDSRMQARKKQPENYLCINNVAGLYPGRDKEGYYLVEHVLKRSARKNEVRYLVRWLGYGPDSDSWEPYEHLNEYGQNYVLERWIKGNKSMPPVTPEEQQVVEEHLEETKRITEERNAKRRRCDIPLNYCSDQEESLGDISENNRRMSTYVDKDWIDERESNNDYDTASDDEVSSIGTDIDLVMTTMPCGGSISLGKRVVHKIPPAVVSPTQPLRNFVNIQKQQHRGKMFNLDGSLQRIINASTMDPAVEASLRADFMRECGLLTHALQHPFLKQRIAREVDGNIKEIIEVLQLTRTLLMQVGHQESLPPPHFREVNHSLARNAKHAGNCNKQVRRSDGETSTFNGSFTTCGSFNLLDDASFMISCGEQHDGVHPSKQLRQQGLGGYHHQVNEQQQDDYSPLSISLKNGVGDSVISSDCDDDFATTTGGGGYATQEEDEDKVGRLFISHVVTSSSSEYGSISGSDDDYQNNTVNVGF